MCFLSCCCCCYFFFTLVRLTLELLAINVEKHLRWRPHTRLFFVFTEKNISLFGEDNFGFNQPINFKNQNSLDTRSFSAIFHEVPEADNCAHKCAHYAPSPTFLWSKNEKGKQKKKKKESQRKNY